MSKRASFSGSVRNRILTIGMIFAAALVGFAQDKGAVETIDATAMGTSTQMGRNVNIKLRIYSYSSPEERQALVDAFRQGQSEGLNKALSKMKSVGRISLPGTVGYDLAYVREIPTPTGRKVRFVTDRKIAFGEAANTTRSMSYNLTAGEIDLNDQDKSKSTGVLFPAAQLIINKDGELQMELYQNPWRLESIIEWKKEEKD